MKLNRPEKLAILFLCVMSFSLPAKLFAQANPQTSYDLKSMLPTSPEASMLARFGDVPVGYYTGTADISIPLYTIKEDGLDIPIVLSYHSSGIKVADQATNVGLGWLLEPGGSIIQIVNGKADASDTYVSTSPSDYAFLLAHVTDPDDQGARSQIGVGSYPCSSNFNDGDTQNSMGLLQQGDLQPDVYQYNFPGGYSGKFYINPQTKLPVLIDKQQQIFFQNTPNAENASWVATTLNGDKYYFIDEETSTDGTAFHQGYTYKLNKIVLHNGKMITYTYTSNTYSLNTSYYEYYHTPYPSAVGGLQTTAEYSIQAQGSNINYYNKTISQISTDDVIINFNPGTRLDLPSPSIQSVDIINASTNKKIKTFTFNYNYFASSMIGIPTNGNQVSGGRLKLVSLQETGYDPVTAAATNNPPYQFTYNETTPLPEITSFAKDYWGYYNGINNSNLLGDLHYPYYAGMLGANFPYYTVGYINGANRAVDTSQVSLGMLTQITYPTGGSTQFKYESNSFSIYNYPDVNKEASALTNLNASDQNAPTDNTTISFTPARTMTLPVNILFSKGYPGNNITLAQMSPAYVSINKIENEVTTTLKTWQIITTAQQTAYTNTGNVTIQDTIQIMYDPNATYQLVSSLPDALGDQAGNANLGANVTAQIQYYNVPNYTTNLSYGGGVRVAGIKNYDINGTLISNKSIKYINPDGTCSGLLMSQLLLDYYRNIQFEYQVPNNGATTYNLNQAYANIWYLSSESAVPFSTAAGGNLVGYSRVEETELANNAPTNGKHVYSYVNSPSQTSISVPDDPNLLNGKILAEQIFDNSGNELSQTSYAYTSLSDTVFTGYKNFYNLISNANCEDYGIQSFFVLYNILEYPIASHWYMLSNKSTTQFNSGNAITFNNYYRYNAMGQLAQDSTIDSRGESLTTTYRYPYDEYSTSATAASLVDSAFYNNLMEQHFLNNNVETSKAIVSYATINNQLVRSGIQRSYNGNPLYTDVTFDAYGPNKTIQQATEKAVQSSAFIYDLYNKELLAEVKNALITDIAYSSFELNQPGSWTMNTAGITSGGFSGSQSYLLSGSNTLSKSGLNSSKTYVVSYWTTASSPLTITGTIATYPIKGVTIGGWTYYEHQVTGETTITLSGTSDIDEVRLYPNDAQMKSYTYAPLIGINSSVNEKNELSLYDYDSFQRLVNIKDQYGNVIRHMSYHYQGQ